jgi:ABC-type polysaccharide transport system permease subunit
LKRIGIALVSAASGLLGGAVVYYLLYSVLRVNQLAAQIAAVILTLVVAFGLAVLLARQSRGVAASLILTAIAVPTLLVGFLACGLVWTILSVLLQGG